MDSDDDFDSRPVVRRGGPIKVNLNSNNLPPIQKCDATEENFDNLQIKPREVQKSVSSSPGLNNTAIKSIEPFESELNGVVNDFNNLTVEPKPKTKSSDLQTNSHNNDGKPFETDNVLLNKNKKTLSFDDDCSTKKPLKSSVVPNDEATVNMAAALNGLSNHALEESR